jgi:lactoylglutathione lyase
VGPRARGRGGRAGAGRELTRLSFIVVYVRDVPAELTFYEQAFGLERRHLDTRENGAYGELSTGETVVAFASHELVRRHLPVPFRAHDPGDEPMGVEITLELENLDEAVERALAAGATLVAAPELKGWGQRYAFIRDPEGVLLGLTDPPPDDRT